jgi:hypothetical protein
LAIAITAGCGSSETASQVNLASVTVPSTGSVRDFVKGRFKEEVTCRQACSVNTSVAIRKAVAERLGFANVSGKLVTIATNKRTLKAEAPASLSFVLTPQAKLHLAKATGSLQIFGAVNAVPKRNPNTNVSVGWASELT